MYPPEPWGHRDPADEVARQGATRCASTREQPTLFSHQQFQHGAEWAEQSLQWEWEWAKGASGLGSVGWAVLALRRGTCQTPPSGLCDLSPVSFPKSSICPMHLRLVSLASSGPAKGATPSRALHGFSLNFCLFSRSVIV